MPFAQYAALVEFGAPLEGVSPEDFSQPGAFFRMGQPPLMVDILPEISGVDFDSAWGARTEVPVEPEGGPTACFLSLNDLIASKLASGRPQDLADVAALRQSAQGSSTRTADPGSAPSTHEK
jgi:hypothetical protein